MIDYAKARMRDPGSFEHIETLVAPGDRSGEQIVLMTYRGRNEFGGMAMDRIVVRMHNKDCSVAGPA
ncbi:MAG: hypothetical protein Q8R02_24055 [Hyphomonadaceae bacterium]|nr:hypothetical protein [Hyphomonadaceae bacterium]